MSREAFEKSLRAAYMPSKFNRFPDGKYRVAWMERDWQAWKRAEQHFEQELFMLNTEIAGLIAERDFYQQQEMTAHKACDALTAERDRLRAAGRALLACPHIAERDMEDAWHEPETEQAIAEMRDALKESDDAINSG